MIKREFAKALRQNMTEAENLLWRHLRGHRLGGAKFRRQQPIGPYVVDFVHFGARLVVEADGGQHNDSPADARRDAWLISQGFRVMRFWNNEILNNAGAVLEAVMSAVEGACPPSPPAPLPQGERGDNMTPSPARGEGAIQTPQPSPAKREPSPLPSPLAGEGSGERETSSTNPIALQT